MDLTLWRDAGHLVEERLKSESLFRGKLLDVYIDTVQLPDGNRSTREWIRHPGACAVVPVFRDGTIMLVKQYRYPVGQIFYEVPAGKIDSGEPPEQTASRETGEETGLHAGSISYIGHFYPVIGYSDEVIHIYAAWDLQTRTTDVEADEFLIPQRVPFATALEMIATGEITDAKTICSLVRTRMWWERHAPFAVDF